MSNVMSQLRFVTAAKPAIANTLSPTDRRRVALTVRIDEQIALASAQIEGKSFEPTRTKTITDKTTGEKSKQTVVKKVSQWYWQANGRYLVTIRYGVKPLTFAKGANAVEAPSLKAVVTVLTTIKQAVQAGELDAAIEAVTSKREAKKPAASK